LIFAIKDLWRGAVVVRVSDLQPIGRRFESRSLHFIHVTTLGKLFTLVCLCLPSSINWYQSKGGDAVRLGRSGVTLAMRHRLSGIPTYGLSGLRKEHELALKWNMAPLPLLKDLIKELKLDLKDLRLPS